MARFLVIQYDSDGRDFETHESYESLEAAKDCLLEGASFMSEGGKLQTVITKEGTNLDIYNGSVLVESYTIFVPAVQDS